MERCSIIYNPISTGFNMETLQKVKRKFQSGGFQTKLIQSNWAGHVPQIIKKENKQTDLIVTMGGDGTIGEAIQGFQSCQQQALYSHISTGTANDVCNNFGLNKNPIASAELILEGTPQTMDVITANDYAFGYVSCFGALTNIPYETKLSLKKHLGVNGYIVSALPEVLRILTKKMEKYYITYNKNGEIISSECLLGAVSNSKGFGAIKIYPNANIDDGMFEVVILKEINEKLILSLLKDYLTNSICLEKYDKYIDMFKTNNLNICFNGCPPVKPIDNDGDIAPFTLDHTNDSITYKTNGKVKMLLPNH